MAVQSLPSDYLERVYAGVLGKLIGVYVGRPFEQWTHQRILRELGHIKYYVHERLGEELLVTDDDVSGTFIFVRAIEEHGVQGLSSESIGKTWLNNVVEKKSVFWWGGRGVSTEHTAWLNLKHGIAAPQSGSIAVNGKAVAEQIGAQIFIDGWGLVCPGQPMLAANFAEAAGKVSHDGESVYAAQLWAAMEAEAFISDDIDHLIGTGLSVIPADCLLASLIADVIAWVKEDGDDWLKTRQRIEDEYGYHKWPGVCHVMPNHAIMIMTILYAGHDFSLAMEIINTCGWDTDCNSGNVGCLVAVILGMKAFGPEGPDWRGPLADRALISSADGGYSINNAARIALDVANMGRRVAGEETLAAPKDGAQFHFTLPGSVQGFSTLDPTSTARVQQEIDDAHRPGLRVYLGSGNTVLTTPTGPSIDQFLPNQCYILSSSPLVYPGQKIKVMARSAKDLKKAVDLRIRASTIDSAFEVATMDSNDSITLSPGDDQTHVLEWVLPSFSHSYPTVTLGITIDGCEGGSIWLDRLQWEGVPNMTLTKPPRNGFNGGPTPWDHAWIKGVSDWHTMETPSMILIAQDEGEGIVSYGTREWTDYRVIVQDVDFKLGSPSGVAIRVQGLRRYYALCVAPHGKVVLVKVVDDKRIVLASVDLEWKPEVKYRVILEAKGNKIEGSIGDKTIEAVDDQFESGAMGFVITDGSLSAGQIDIVPA